MNGEGVSVARFPSGPGRSAASRRVPRTGGGLHQSLAAPGCGDTGVKCSCKTQAAGSAFFPKYRVTSLVNFYFFLAPLLTEINLSGVFLLIIVPKCCLLGIPNLGLPKEKGKTKPNPLTIPILI